MATGMQNVFRSKALEQYSLRWEKTILPRVVAPPVFLALWILLGLFLIATTFAWLAEVPVYTTGSGVILSQESALTTGSSDAVAAIFLPATTSVTVKSGESVLVHIGTTGASFTTTVLSIQSHALSPDAIRQQYALSASTGQVVTEPSIVVLVGLGSAISVHTYAGSLVSAQIQVGTQRVLSLLPGFHS